MKPIQFEVDAIPQTGSIDDEGNFKFYVYISNQCDDDFSESIEAMHAIWHLEANISIKVNLKLKDIYKDLFHMYIAHGKIEADEAPLFETLRKDCQWIIDQINSLEKNT